MGFAMVGWVKRPTLHLRGGESVFFTVYAHLTRSIQQSPWLCILYCILNIPFSVLSVHATAWPSATPFRCDTYLWDANLDALVQGFILRLSNHRYTLAAKPYTRHTKDLSSYVTGGVRTMSTLFVANLPSLAAILVIRTSKSFNWPNLQRYRRLKIVWLGLTILFLFILKKIAPLGLLTYFETLNLLPNIMPDSKTQTWKTFHKLNGDFKS
jgi:hypothetical protein